MGVALDVVPIRQSISNLTETPIAISLFVLTVASMAVAAIFPAVSDALVGDGVALRHGQIWRLVTYVLTHNGWAHLAVNMVLLYLFVPQLERLIGGARLVAVYLGCAVIGQAVLFAIFPGPSRSFGASAAIFGVAGALVAAHAADDARRSAAIIVALTLLAMAGLPTLGGVGTLAAPGLQGYSFGVLVHALGLLPGVALGLSLGTHSPPRLAGIAVAVAAIAAAAIGVGLARSEGHAQAPGQAQPGMSRTTS